MKNIYCPHCQKTVPFSVKPVEITQIFFSKHYRTVGKKMFCEVCHHEISSEKLEKENDSKLREAYKVQKGLITNKEILFILDTYCLTKIGLSTLLGWGHVTLQRYLSQVAFPKPMFSNKLYELRNPHYVKQLLKERGNQLKPYTYNECSSAVERLISYGVDDIFIKFNPDEESGATQLSFEPNTEPTITYEETADTVYQKMMQTTPLALAEAPKEKPQRHPDFKPLKTFIDVGDAKMLECLLVKAFKMRAEDATGLASYKHLQWHPLTAATLLISPLFYAGIIPSLDFFDKGLSIYRVLLTPPQKNPVTKEAIEGFIIFLSETVVPYYDKLTRIVCTEPTEGQ